jgi:DNA (cytosine-5)-methyltransferase 1
VADTERQRDQRRRESSVVGCAAEAEPREALQRERDGNAATDRGAAVGYADESRSQGRRLCGVQRAHERAPWPPGPADAVGWREYLARRPGTEPAICRGTDGLADRLDRLRLLGNGVVPEQATFAIIELWRELHS